MKRLVVDIETTGFSKQYDHIVSFAYAEFSEDMSTLLDSGVLYYYKEGMSWSTQAEAVHGLSRQFLSQYKDDYSDNLKTMFKKVARANLIGFNNNTFDDPFISSFLHREMYGPQTYNSSVDLMKVFRPVLKRSFKLIELVEYLGFNDFVLENLSQKWFGESFGWHKAHGDVVATTLCALEAKRRGLI